jgi:hypothetical protein
MKYLKYLIEDKNIQTLLLEKQNVISDKTEEFLIFSEQLRQYVYENLEVFIDENNTFFNIKKFALDQSLKFYQESLTASLIKTASVGVSSIIGWEWIKSFLNSLWEPVAKPFKPFVITIDDTLKQKLSEFHNKSPNEIPSKITIDPEPEHFIAMPFLTILAIASTIFTGSKLLEQYNTIGKISRLKDSIDKTFDRLTSLGIREASNYKQFNTNKYEESINRCKDKTSPFDTFEINVSCPLDAYLTYCSSMILSMTNIYLTRVSRNVSLTNIDNMRSVLAIKEDFAVNQMLTSIYNSFCFAIDFIYKEEPGISIKWKSFIDNNIEKIVSNIKPNKPQTQSEGSNVRQNQQPYKRY